VAGLASTGARDQQGKAPDPEAQRGKNARQEAGSGEAADPETSRGEAGLEAIAASDRVSDSSSAAVRSELERICSIETVLGFD
jgi:hypothetical protein